MSLLKQLAVGAKLFILALFAVGAFGLNACCRENLRSSPRPDKVLENYASSLKTGKTKQALALISTDRNPPPSESELKEFLKNTGSSLDELLDAVISRKGVSIRWIMVLPDGRKILLARERDGWKIASGPILPGWELTAEQALLDFISAVKRADCKAVTNFAPPEIRAKYSSGEIEHACDRLIESLKLTTKTIKENISDLVYLTKNRAELPYGKNGKVVLEKKGGRWFIKDL